MVEWIAETVEYTIKENKQNRKCLKGIEREREGG